MKKQDKEIKKQFYDVKVSVLVPAIFLYRVEAENEQEAIKNCDKLKPKNIKLEYNKKINIKALVYQAGTYMLKLSKDLKK